LQRQAVAADELGLDHGAGSPSARLGRRVDVPHDGQRARAPLEANIRGLARLQAQHRGGAELGRSSSRSPDIAPRRQRVEARRPQRALELGCTCAGQAGEQLLGLADLLVLPGLDAAPPRSSRRHVDDNQCRDPCGCRLSINAIWAAHPLSASSSAPFGLEVLNSNPHGTPRELERRSILSLAPSTCRATTRSHAGTGFSVIKFVGPTARALRGRTSALRTAHTYLTAHLLHLWPVGASV